MNNSVYLASKPRYEILDGLRGVASILVVLFHIFETYSTSAADQIINHGYLAVDFFFVLSGFVVGYAYDDRWSKMTTWGFFKRRLVRLQPMVIMGTLIGACLFYLGQDGFPLIGQAGGWKFLLVTLMGCCMIPCGKGMDIRGWGETNPLNGPNWSLTYEYIANILYALVIRRFSTWLLTIFVALSAFLTLDLCLNLNVFGLLTPERDSKMFTVIGGWSLTPEQIYIGFTRLLYPFFCGLLISRIGKYIKVRRGFWWCSFALIVLFAIPCVGGAGSILNGWYNAACILLLFPLIVSIGAGSTISGKRSEKICSLLGGISYPLYITHYPLIYLQVDWAFNHPDASLAAHIATSAGVFILSVAIAYACLKLYDEPVRDWLKRHWLMKK